jgi:hypothetical protein
MESRILIIHLNLYFSNKKNYSDREIIETKVKI